MSNHINYHGFFEAYLNGIAKSVDPRNEIKINSKKRNIDNISTAWQQVGQSLSSSMSKVSSRVDA
ncbi:MAG: hypothetical protein KU37_11570 [Sulfuricurvum sp. PC08-66]|nr:MAG: hypothetical protein KU37_11570 [Sulfuricurvum sp. PC08-66]